MPRKSWSFTRILVSTVVLGVLLVRLAVAAGGKMPIDDTELRLPDGREIVLDLRGEHSHEVLLLASDRLLWSRVYEEEYDRLWDYAFFVPVKSGRRYVYDVNGDGYPEIAIATWDGGNNIANRTALVFTVLPASLEYYATEKFNLEYGEYVYK